MSTATQSTAIHAVCPGCGKVVRIAAERMQDRPRCPSCKQGIFTGEPVVLDDRSFGNFISGNDLPVLVDFWAPWCGPCHTFGPVIEQAAKAFSTQVIVAKVNSDEAPAASQRLQIRSIPTVVLFSQGREIARQTGAMPMNTLRQWMSASGVMRPE
jgi:thioredoxin 2